MNDPMAPLLEEALLAIRCLRDYVAAIPAEVADALPAMPGVDGDWLDMTEERLQAAQINSRAHSITCQSEGVSPDQTKSEMPLCSGELQSMRTLCHGVVEWRVENPVTGDFCFHGDQRDVQEWFTDHKHRFPQSQFANYVVAKHVVRTPVQEALGRCLDAIEHRKYCG